MRHIKVCFPLLMLACHFVHAQSSRRIAVIASNGDLARNFPAFAFAETQVTDSTDGEAHQPARSHSD